MAHRFFNCKTLDTFTSSLASGSILENDIVFIEGTSQIWTHNKYYSCPYTKEELDSLVTKDKVESVLTGLITSHTHKYAGSSSAGGSATKAISDSAGQQINTTYIKGLSVSGKTVTYTKGDGTTGTITTQDTTYSAGNGISLSGTTFSNSGVRSVTAGSSANQIKVNTNGTESTITVNNVASATSATKATQDSAGQQINTTYIKGLSVSGKVITYTKGDGTTGTITTQDTNTTYNFSGSTFYSGNQNTSEHDANKSLKNGHYYYSTNGPSTDLGASTADGGLYVQSYSDTWVGQIAQDYRNGRLFVRGKNNGTWQNWLKVIDSGNIGSQSVASATTASKLVTARSIDGVSFNGTANIVHYGTCSTAVGTAAKAVTLTGFSLVAGSRVMVKFTNGNSAASMTLNVSSTGAKSISRCGSVITDARKLKFVAGEVAEFVYDGTNYEILSMNELSDWSYI